jgi:hypothetical protein
MLQQFFFSRTRLSSSRRLLAFLPLLALGITLLPGCSGDFSFFTKEGRVKGHIDERTGAISIATPKGRLRGRVDPNGGGFQIDGPGVHLRAQGDQRGGSLVARTPEANLRVKTRGNRGLVELDSRQAQVHQQFRVTPRQVQAALASQGISLSQAPPTQTGSPSGSTPETVAKAREDQPQLLAYQDTPSFEGFLR